MKCVLWLPLHVNARQAPAEDADERGAHVGTKTHVYTAVIQLVATRHCADLLCPRHTRLSGMLRDVGSVMTPFRRPSPA